MSIIKCENLTALFQRVLDLIDPRLAGHGMRVACTVARMLHVNGDLPEERICGLCIAALLHDIGACDPDEIGRIVEPDANGVQRHCTAGYLLLRECPPLKDFAGVVLHHHTPCSDLAGCPDDIAFYAQVLNLADRVDVLMMGGARDAKTIDGYLARAGRRTFLPKVVDLFDRTDFYYDICYGLQADITLDNLFGPPCYSDEDLWEFLTMLVLSADFRSRRTAADSAAAAVISRELGVCLGLREDELDKLVAGCLLRDIGKVGVPVSLLEKEEGLARDEQTAVRRHVDIGFDILHGLVDGDVVKIACRHHERLDGSGYPNQLDATSLRRTDRIVAVADVVAALRGAEGSGEACSKGQIFSLLDAAQSTGGLDKIVVDTLKAHYDDIAAKADRTSRPVLERCRAFWAELDRVTEPVQPRAGRQDAPVNV